MKTGLTLGALLMGASAFIAAQAPAPPRLGQVASPVSDPNAKSTAVIRGRILLVDGRPARRAAVRLQRPGDASPRVVIADVSGRYEFTEVRDGEYRVSAGKPGYLGVEYGQRRAQEPGTALTIAAGETRERVDITLPSSGVIAGRVVDERGDPVEAVTVTLLQSVFAASRRQLIPVPGIGGRTTDDEGRYRLYAVPPGQFVVVARPADAVVPPGYTSTYLPGAANAAGARVVTVGVSQESAEADITLARVATSRVSGVVLDSTGKPVVARVFLIPAARSGGSSEMEWVSAVSGGDGRFEIASVSPGEWVLQAAAAPPLSARPPQEGEFVSQRVSVSGAGLRDIPLQLSAGSRVAGRVVFEGDAPPNRTAVTIGTLPADANRAPFMGGVVSLPNGVVTGTQATAASPATATAQVQSDGSFQLEGLNGPRRFRLVRAPEGWSVKAIRVNGRDVTDEALSFGTRDESLTDVEIVLTNRAASVGGLVTDARGQAATDYAVLVFAADSARWYPGSRYLAFTRAKPDGSFSVANLPQGEYYAAAVDWLQGTDSYGEWQDPDFLASIAPRANRIVLSDGQPMSVSPRLIIR